MKSSAAMDRVCVQLLERGICIQRAHHVGAGVEGVLRVVAFSTHTAEQINRLLEESGKVA